MSEELAAFIRATNRETGKYMSDCHAVGTGGGCGITCFVFLNGNCHNVSEDPEEWLKRAGSEMLKELGYEV